MNTRIFSVLAMAVIIGFASVASAGDAMEKAKVHFEKGVELFKNDDYEAALVEFKAAYRAKPHYAVRYNIGICLYELHRSGSASPTAGAPSCTTPTATPAIPRRRSASWRWAAAIRS
jgi:tetratricopeptide (TPR) repeat protein